MNRFFTFSPVKLLISVLVVFCFYFHVHTENSGKKLFTSLKGAYLEQTPPENNPQLFSPGVVSTGYFEHSSPTFSPDGNEILWSIHYPDGFNPANPILYMKKINGIWTEPIIPIFSGNYDAGNPTFSPDGNRIYFQSNRPVKNRKSGITDIWYVERTETGWSKPVHLDSNINSTQREAQATISTYKTLYFLSYYKDAKPPYGLYYSEFKNGSYQTKKLMDKKFNTQYPDWTPYIAPDESYFIFCSFRPGGIGSGDLYISFKQDNGQWGQIKNMGNKINTPGNERFPVVTPDGKYLFFNSTKRIPGADKNSPGNGNGDIYWISSKIIDYLKTENLNISEILEKAFNENGIENVLKNFRELRKKHSMFYNFDETVLLMVGMNLIQSGQIQSALEIFQENAKLFPDKLPTSQTLLLSLFDENPEKFKDHCEYLESQNDHLSRFVEDEFNTLGYQLINLHKIIEAERVFKLNTKLFPDSGNVFDSYGECLMNIGKIDAALENYKKSLKLDSENKNAEAMIKKLILMKNRNK